MAHEVPHKRKVFIQSSQLLILELIPSIISAYFFLLCLVILYFPINIFSAQVHPYDPPSTMYKPFWGGLYEPRELLIP